MNTVDQRRPRSRHERLVQDLFDALSTSDIERALTFWASNCIDHATIQGAPPGKPGVRDTMLFVNAAFPSATWHVTAMVADRHDVACQVVVEGVHEAAIYGVPPTGRSVRWRHFHRFHFDGDQIVEHDAVRDDRGLLQQLGAKLVVISQPNRTSP